MLYIPRDLERTLKKYAHRREIIAVQGPRQVGKTTLLKQIYENTGGERAFVNLDLPEERRALSKNPTAFLRRHLPGKKGTLFLDEVQNVKNAGQSLKIIYDTFPDVKMYVSGSSSLKIRKDVATALVGRILGFDLYPFNFQEFLRVKDEGLAELHREYRDATVKALQNGDDIPEGDYSNQFRHCLEEYMRYGGYPAAVIEDDEEVKQKILSEVVATYLERDVTAYFGVKSTEKFMDFLRVLARATGTPTSISSLADAARTTHKTAERFISILEMSYIAQRIRPYHGNVVTEMRKAPKVYFIDTGIRNTILRNFLPMECRTDAGQILENFVFRELLEYVGGKIKYWRTKAGAEMDFVIDGDRPIPIEVKLGGKPSRGFHSFLRAYKPEVAFVVTLDRAEKVKMGDSTIHYVPAWYL